jgi:tetratricopeptide (TPR) repeat protein
MRGLGARFPESADIQEKYGEWLHHNGDRDGAEAAFRKAVDLAPNDAAKLIRLARALPRGGRAEAIALYRRALALPEAPVLVRVRAYDRLARTLQAEERHPEAVAVLREGLQVLGSVADAKTLGDWTAAVEAMGGHVPAPPPVSPAQVSGWQRVTAQVVSALRRSGLGRTL